MPEFLESLFKAQQRVIGSPTGFLRIVAYSRPFLGTVDHDDHRIEIKDKAGARIGKRKQVSPEAVVKSYQLPYALWREPSQETSQRGLIREAFQAKHLQKRSIVLKDLRLVNAPQTHDNGKKQCHDQFVGLELRNSPVNRHIPPQQALETKLLTKTLNQPHAPEVRDMAFLEGKRYFSRRFSHLPKSYHLGAFRTDEFYHAKLTKISNSPLLRRARFAHF
jgi:hypothetical protein